MHKLRTVTLLDVSAVAGHHAMPAALLFFLDKVVELSLARDTYSICLIIKMGVYPSHMIDLVFEIVLEVKKTHLMLGIR